MHKTRGICFSCSRGSRCPGPGAQTISRCPAQARRQSLNVWILPRRQDCLRYKYGSRRADKIHFAKCAKWRRDVCATRAVGGHAGCEGRMRRLKVRAKGTIVRRAHPQFQRRASGREYSRIGLPRKIVDRDTAEPVDGLSLRWPGLWPRAGGGEAASELGQNHPGIENNGDAASGCESSTAAGNSRAR